MKIGILGGSFNPVHTGHMIVANYCAQRCGLDRVVMMVSPRNPLKEDAGLASQEDRLEMCRIAARACPGVEASDLEFSMPLPSFTCRTLSRLRELHPDDSFTLIIGSDNWQIFPQWRDSDVILREFEVLVYPRPGYEIDADSLPANVRLITDPQAPLALISSTFVREVLDRDGSAAYFIPLAVEEYILKNHLYGK